MTGVEGVRQLAGEGMANFSILPFPLLHIVDPPPRCLWCRNCFAPAKPNQLYCKPKHRQRACEQRKVGLVTAVAALLERHGASPQRAQDAAALVVEAYYASGRIQGAVAALGWCYDEVGRAWRMA